MSSESLVSVIVPVYNVSEYIEKCVKSLICQTHQNLEIILVDDGSPDQSAAICERMAAGDRRIKVIHKENGGLSSARNAGIAEAKGDYLAFVDGDDFVRADYIQVLLDACEGRHVKIAACGYVEYYSEDKQTVFCGKDSYTISGQEAVKDIFTMKNDIHVVAWNKLYARSLFTELGIRYPAGKIHEDVFTTYKLCAAVPEVAYVNRPCYYYVQRQGSIISQRFSPRRLQLLEAVESIAPFVREHTPVYDGEYRFYRFQNHLTILNAMADSGYEDEALFRKVAAEVFSMLPDLKGNPNFGSIQRCAVAAMRLGMNGFYWIRKLYRYIR